MPPRLLRRTFCAVIRISNICSHIILLWLTMVNRYFTSIAPASRIKTDQLIEEEYYAADH